MADLPRTRLKSGENPMLKFYQKRCSASGLVSVSADVPVPRWLNKWTRSEINLSVTACDKPGWFLPSSESLNVMAASNDIPIDPILLAQAQSVLGIKIPQEIIGKIVDELEDSSLHAFCLATAFFVRATQARIFRSLQIRVNVPYARPAAKDFKQLSPWQAERLFMSSPHLAQYVKRLWIDIPPPQREAGGRFIFIPGIRPVPAPPKPTDCYPPLQTVLPVFTAVRQLEISGPTHRRWVDLPQALKDAIQPIMSLPSIEEIQLSGLSIPAALIRLAVQSAPVLTLFGVAVEDAGEPVPSPAGNLTLRKLTIVNTTKTMVDFLTSPGAPSVHQLSNMFAGELGQGPKNSPSVRDHTRLPTLVHDRYAKCFAVQAPRLPALRVLELEMTGNTAPFCLPDLFISLLTQIPNAMPRLEQVALRVTVASVPLHIRTNRGMQQLPLPGESSESAWTWAHSGPLDLDSLPAVHCLLRFHDDPHPRRVVSESQARERELLREEGYAGFVRCMEELLPALRDNGRLSFSQIFPSAYTKFISGIFGMYD
ncbi:hypothetical protein MSAN_00651600 [Mycena sanguinolenta]|uniref:Uncharacterized protein n=1 Tax=Mycena sanguinolenta TaxID=230812 RepID=A0A8H6Z0Z5_9AGAR|nr:hypothetical protein MSAN_00651600 [Mycena sanguinolenta]